MVLYTRTISCGKLIHMLPLRLSIVKIILTGDRRYYNTKLEQIIVGLDMYSREIYGN